MPGSPCPDMLPRRCWASSRCCFASLLIAVVRAKTVPSRIWFCDINSRCRFVASQRRAYATGTGSFGSGSGGSGRRNGLVNSGSCDRRR
jgi:hypothetical protein